jgi:hypothetical protein
VVVVAACYLAGAILVTCRLWADPASRVVTGNAPDADAVAWFLRYQATAVAHGRLPALITTALNAPRGVNLMWNTFLLPGLLTAPVTLGFGPQVSLTLITTAGFAGSAAAMFYVLRRWGVTVGAAGLAGAVYGFSPALLHSAIGHYNLQVGVLLPPLIVDRVLRLAASQRRAWLREGAWLGALCTAQIFIAEELLAQTALATLLLLVALALGAARLTWERVLTLLRGLGVAGGTVLVLTGYPLWVQFFGPLTERGSPFPRDAFHNNATGFVIPSGYMLFHTSGSAAAAARFPFGAPEYLAYLGVPVLVALIAIAVACRRHSVVAACALVFVLLEMLSLGGQGQIPGSHAAISLPWAWLTRVPLLGLGLADRLSILADGFAAAVIAFGLDALLARIRETGPRWPAVALWSAAVAAVLPLTPLPLPASAAPALPAGWQAVFAELRLPPGASVLTVPVPGGWPTTAPMRWQADTGSPASLIGGYFQGPDRHGHGAVDGTGMRPTATYLDKLWLGHPPRSAPTTAQVQDDLQYWQPAAVVAVALPHSPVCRYLTQLFGPPSVRAGHVIAWRLVGRPMVAAMPVLGK